MSPAAPPPDLSPARHAGGAGDGEQQLATDRAEPAPHCSGPGAPSAPTCTPTGESTDGAQGERTASDPFARHLAAVEAFSARVDEFGSDLEEHGRRVEALLEGKC